MDLRIIIILAGVFGLIYLFKITNNFARIITGLMVVAIAISFVRVPEIAIDGYYLFAITQLLIIIYAFSYEDFSTNKKITVATIAFLGLASIVLLLGAPEGIRAYGDFYLRLLEFSGLVAGVIIGLYIYVLIKDIKSYKEEIGFLTILSADALIRFALYILALM